MDLIKIDNVSRRFGSVQALNNVTLSLGAGTVGLVGNNGSGKSTLMKILLGLLPADSGNGTILGCDIRHATRELRGRVGYMPEAEGIIPVLSGVEFVTLGGDLYGMPHRDAKRRAHEMLNYVGLGELRYRRVEEYSTGNLQRLKLAAALVHDPELLLLDEPTNGLDPVGRVAMLRLIEDLIEATEKSVILCTHLLGDVQRLCQHIVVLHLGRVLQSGPMADVRQRFGNRYRLTCQGDSSALFHALRQSGADVVSDSSPDRAIVTVPSGWTTTELFKLARAKGAVVAELQVEEENIEQMFHRVTHGEAAGEAVRDSISAEE